VKKFDAEWGICCFSLRRGKQIATHNTREDDSPMMGFSLHAPQHFSKTSFFHLGILSVVLPGMGSYEGFCRRIHAPWTNREQRQRRAILVAHAR